MTPLGRIAGEVLTEFGGKVKWTPRGDGQIQLGIALAEDLERSLPLLVTVGTGDVEVAPVGGDLDPELGATGNALAVEELVFLQSMDGFHVTLPGVGLGWPGR